MKGSKAKKRLEARRSDFTRMMGEKNSQASKAQLRKDNGGYHKPGSNSR